ncbi:DNA methylase, partial [Bacteroides acidifaciens]
ELKQLKSELAALDRKITAELAPKHDETADGEEIKPTAACHQQPANNPTPQSPNQQEDKSTLVAEPHLIYQTVHPLRSTYRPIGL